jgi:hypothetical protein
MREERLTNIPKAELPGGFMPLQPKKIEYLTLPCRKPYQHGGRANF